MSSTTVTKPTNPIIGRGWSFPLGIGVQGGVALTSDRSELDQAIVIILSTYPGERVMRPEFGCRLHDLIFAPNDEQTAAQAQRFVQDALGMWEPRIDVMEVDVEPVDNMLRIEIKYRVKVLQDQRSLVYPFYLIPEE